jgi:hypothetical protein
MALSRRLAKVEQDLDPHALFLQWLAQAHAYGSIEAYARWLAGQAEPSVPFATLLDRIEERVRTTHRKESPTVVHREIKAAHRQALLAANVFIRLNVEAEERLVTFGLIQTTLMFWLRELTLRDALAEVGVSEPWLGDAEGLERSWRHWRDAAAALLVGLAEAGQGREALEGSHLSGHDSLFPAAAQSWRDLAERAGDLYEMAIALRQDDRFESLDAMRELAVAGAEATARRIVRMASYEVHRALGEDDRAGAAIKQIMAA